MMTISSCSTSVMCMPIIVVYNAAVLICAEGYVPTTVIQTVYKLLQPATCLHGYNISTVYMYANCKVI